MITILAFFLGFPGLAAVTHGMDNPCSGVETCLILVRHAEKVDQSRDAALSQKGFKRAEKLAKVLADWGVALEGVHSTNYQRTRDTATPAAEAANLALILYKATDLPGFAKRVSTLKGAHLILGHSNTTPQLAELLGAAKGAVQIPDDQYGLIVVITNPGSADGGLTLRTY